MCGISGCWDPLQQTSQDTLCAIAAQMADTMRHRGPDAGGIWADAAAGIALGHRRLAIVDLSPLGHQPMHSADGRFVLVFNGEIYNFTELRKELVALGHAFRGTSDTEVMLAAFCEWGVKPALQRFAGMYAFALWDKHERVLYLARDRLGEKPLYYGWTGQAFVFGSELKALRAHPAWEGSINRNALALLLRHNYIPAPYSIYCGIQKRPAATLLALPLTPLSPGTVPDPLPYWSAREAAEQGAANPFVGSDAEAVTHLDTLLREVVAQQMIADVPLGAFLSGGIDSSLIVALMQAQSARPVRTFTIGFHEASHNEAVYAKAVASHLGTEHTEMYVSPQEALDVIPRLPTLYDEPFADPSQIPTFLVSAMTRRHVTVSLSGDGGDELFGGYDHYSYAQNIWHKIGWMPYLVRYALSRMLLIIPPAVLNHSLGLLTPVLGKRKSIEPMSSRVYKVADLLAAVTADRLSQHVTTCWNNASSPTATISNLTSVQAQQEVTLSDMTSRMMYLDAMTYLPDDIMVKVDRAAMGVGLETRAPLLHHQGFEFAWRLPLIMKVRERSRKWLLRQILYQYVPLALVERPKAGFGVPLEAWLQGPLREWAEALLDSQRLQREGFLQPEPVRAAWSEHLAGTRERLYELWSVLMFQAWLEQETTV